MQWFYQTKTKLITMRKPYLLFILILFPFILITDSFAQNGNDNLKKNHIHIPSLEQEAETFANRISNLIDLSEEQTQQLKDLRWEYLKQLRKVTYKNKATDEELKEKKNLLQAEYDKNFSLLLTIQQKNKIMRREFAQR